MRIDFEGGHITIPDDDPKAVKIRQGYSYIFENGELKIGTKIGFDKETFKAKLKNGTATLADIREFILTLL